MRVGAGLDRRLSINPVSTKKKSAKPMGLALFLICLSDMV